MRKIRLRLESLAVESFDTTVPEPPEGTVVAHQMETRGCSAMDSCYQTFCTCPEINTCMQSCNGTCVGATCLNTCLGTCATCGANTCEPTCGPYCTGWCWP